MVRSSNGRPNEDEYRRMADRFGWFFGTLFAVSVVAAALYFLYW